MRPFAPSVNDYQPIRREPRTTMSNPTTQVLSDAFSAPRRHLQRENGSNVDSRSAEPEDATRERSRNAVSLSGHRVCVVCRVALTRHRSDASDCEGRSRSKLSMSTAGRVEVRQKPDHCVSVGVTNQDRHSILCKSLPQWCWCLNGCFVVLRRSQIQRTAKRCLVGPFRSSTDHRRRTDGGYNDGCREARRRDECGDKDFPWVGLLRLIVSGEPMERNSESPTSCTVPGLSVANVQRRAIFA